MSDNAERLERCAELAVRVGANVQAGQEVFVFALVEHVELARALVRQAYKAGASYVHIIYQDDHVRHARIGLGPDAALTYSPEWERHLTKAMEGNAQIGTMGRPEPQLLADLDGDRIGRAIQVEIAEIVQQQHRDNSVNWCAVGAPNEGWARQVFGEPDVGRLWDEVAFCMRLDEPDPVAAWREHMARLDARAAALTNLRPDALRYRGPGTDLTVGLLPTARWGSARFRTSTGIDYVANLPTEEIFTTPDPLRAEGVVTSTKPLDLNGALVEGLTIRFEGGRAVQIDADSGVDAMRSRCAKDEGASRLGELALVDREGRIGKTGTVFFNTLLDENAASHLAFGNAYAIAVGDEDHDRINKSAIHVDFMVGGDDVSVTGLTKDGREVPLLRGGSWQL